MWTELFSGNQRSNVAGENKWEKKYLIKNRCHRRKTFGGVVFLGSSIENQWAQLACGLHFMHINACLCGCVCKNDCCGICEGVSKLLRLHYWQPHCCGFPPSYPEEHNRYVECLAKTNSDTWDYCRKRKNLLIRVVLWPFKWQSIHRLFIQIRTDSCVGYEIFQYVECACVCVYDFYVVAHIKMILLSLIGIEFRICYN